LCYKDEIYPRGATLVACFAGRSSTQIAQNWTRHQLPYGYGGSRTSTNAEVTLLITSDLSPTLCECKGLKSRILCDLCDL